MLILYDFLSSIKQSRSAIGPLVGVENPTKYPAIPGQHKIDLPRTSRNCASMAWDDALKKQVFPTFSKPPAIDKFHQLEEQLAQLKEQGQVKPSQIGWIWIKIPQNGTIYYGLVIPMPMILGQNVSI